jgi:hypothetical protein
VKGGHVDPSESTDVHGASCETPLKIDPPHLKVLRSILGLEQAEGG